MGCLIEDKKCKSRKGHAGKKMHFELSPLDVWIALWIVNTYFVNIVSNKREILQHVKVYACCQQRQGHSNTSGFLRKQPS